MEIILKIKRSGDGETKDVRYQEYTIEAGENDRLLDALVYVQTRLDGTLGFRKSCAHGICGSDAMIINGVERLACKTLIKDVADVDNNVITVEPLANMPVHRDLIVDQGRFFRNYRLVIPYLIPGEESPRGEYAQSREERALFDDPTKCILCGACYSSCPVIRGENPDFIGPAAVVNAARFVFDSRDSGFEVRLSVLDDTNGVWPCENHFNCTKVCPREIKVTKNINMTKKAIKDFKREKGT
jgi:succinate dehydrogenase / fumarate reductase iron-sulfur subunit